MSKTLTWKHTTTETTTYSGYSVSVHFYAVADITIKAITLYNLKNQYYVSNELRAIDLSCTNALNTITVDTATAVNPNFTLDYAISKGASKTFTISTGSSSRKFDIPVSDSVMANSDGNSGILISGYSNVPAFAVTYEIENTVYFKNVNINDGYPYFRGLPPDDYNNKGGLIMGFTFKNISSNTYGVAREIDIPIKPNTKTYLVNMPCANSSVDFTGANGNYYYEDCIFTYELQIRANNPIELKKILRKVGLWLNGTGTLIDNSGKRYEASCYEGLNYQPELYGKFAKITINFRVKPQFYTDELG